MSWKKKVKKQAWELGKLFLFAFVAAFFIRENVVAAGRVPTGSMEETVMTGSRILINRLIYAVEEPQRGDIVAFYWPDNPKEIFLKRVMGLPGETIQGIDGYVYINGVKLEEDYTPQKLERDFGPFTVPEGGYFMMGDNRNNSKDSRYWQNPYVEKDDMLGRVKIVFYPELKCLE